MAWENFFGAWLLLLRSSWWVSIKASRKQWAKDNTTCLLSFSNRFGFEKKGVQSRIIFMSPKLGSFTFEEFYSNFYYFSHSNLVWSLMSKTNFITGENSTIIVRRQSVMALLLLSLVTRTRIVNSSSWSTDSLTTEEIWEVKRISKSRLWCRSGYRRSFELMLESQTNLFDKP